MSIVKDKYISGKKIATLFSVGDTVKLIDSPLDRIKRGALGHVLEVNGDVVKNEHVMLLVRFRVARTDLPIYTGADRFELVKHEEVLPDAENPTPATEEIVEE